MNLNGHRINALMRKNKNEKYSVQRISLTKRTVVPPNTETVASVQLSTPSDKIFLIRGPEMYHKEISIPYALVSAKNDLSTKGVYFHKKCDEMANSSCFLKNQSIT